MSKTLKISLFGLILVVTSLISASQAQAAAKVQFTADTQLDFANVPATVYVKSGSECDSLTVSASTLKVDVPTGSTFTLKTANSTVLGLTPSAGTVTLAFDTSYFSTGYLSQWIASSSLSTATVSFSLSVPLAQTHYLVKVDGVNLGYYISSSDKLVTFSYTGFSPRTFTIIQEAPVVVAPPVVAPVDVIPPAISQIGVVLGEKEATISWKTDEPSISWILYGTTTDYGLEIKTPTFTTSHSLTLTNLSASTTYHYQIKSKDSADNIDSIADKTFTTLAPKVPKPKVPKPISEITIEELKAEIARITALITQLQQRLAKLSAPKIVGIPADFKFEKNLKYGMVLIDVKYLQIVLNSDLKTRLAETGVGSPGKETNIFGPLTKAAAIKFQERYAPEILAPWGLTKGTGFVGRTTRAKLNELLGR